MKTFVVKMGCFSHFSRRSRREDHVEVLRPHSSRPALGQFPGLRPAPARRRDHRDGIGMVGMWIYGYVKTIHMIYIYDIHMIYIYIIHVCV